MPVLSASSLYEMAMALVCTAQTVNQDGRKNNVCWLRGESFGLATHNANMADEDRNYLKEWRLYRGMSQDELAEKIGTTKAVISLLENEKRPLSSKWLRKLAEALDTQPGYILDHDPNSINSDIFEIWSRLGTTDREQAARILSTFTRTGTKG